MIKIGPFNFKNWSTASKFAKEILNTHRLGEEVTEPEKEFLVAALLLRKDRGSEKIGTGVRRIWVDNNSFGWRGFFLERLDGSETDFSYLKCFSGHTQRTKKSQHMKDIDAACRTAILEDKPFKDRKGYALHHERLPFRELVSGFFKENKINREDIEVEGYKDMEEAKKFKDQAISEAFRDYHRKHASLEVISIEEHKIRHRRVNTNLSSFEKD